MSKPKTYTEEQVKAKVYEALTIQLLRLRNEVFRWAGIDQSTFDREYLNNLGPYERKLAKREGISVRRR